MYEKSYLRAPIYYSLCIASVFIITRALSTPRNVERRESGSIELRAWKHSAEKYHDQTMKFTHFAEGLTILPVILFTPHIYGPSFNSQMFDEFSHDNIVRVRLNVNTNIAGSISFYFNFGKSHCFIIGVKKQFFDKARFFKNMYRVYLAIDDWR